VLAGVSSGSSGHEGDEGGRKNDKASTGFPGWVFMSVKHWDENPLGTWTIRVSDPLNPDTKGKFLGWNMVFWGSSTDTDTSAQSDSHKFELPPDDGNVFPPPDDFKDDDEAESQETTSIVTTTTSSTTIQSASPSTTRSYSKPTHGLSSTEVGQETSVLDAVVTSTATATSSSTATSKPNLDLFLFENPFFVYVGLFFFVLIGIVIYFWLRRRRMQKMNYEELAVAPGEDLPMSRIPRGERGAREMYTAFDEGSDDDDEDAGVEQPMLRNPQPRESSRYQDEMAESELEAQDKRFGNDRDDSASSGSWEHA